MTARKSPRPREVRLHVGTRKGGFVFGSDLKRNVCDGALNAFRTRNGGKTWRKLTKGLPQKNVYTEVLRHAATTDTCDRAGVYVGTIGGAIFFSLNGGDSWANLAAHLPPVMSLETAVL